MTDAFLDSGNEHAPTREEISQINDLVELMAMIADATDVEIAIKTQLEFCVDGDELRARRIAALIYWRQAVKNLKNRVNGLRAASTREAKAGEAA